MTDRVGKMTIQLTLGAMIRGEVRRAVESRAWGLGLDVGVQESKGFFESLYLFTFDGEESGLRSMFLWLRDLADIHGTSFQPPKGAPREWLSA